MRIAINGWFLGQTNTGSGQYLHHLLAHLPREAPSSRFVLFFPKGFNSGQEIHAQELLGAGHPPNLEIAELALPQSVQNFIPRNLAKLWWEQITVPWSARRHQCDVLWVPYWAAPYWQPRPTVVTIHDLIPALLPDYRGGCLQRMYTSLVSQTAKQASAVITVSHASARDIVVHLRIPGERVHAIHHGVNQSELSSPDQRYLEEVRQRYSLPERFFLYLGGFDVRKNVRTTLLAYRAYLDRGGDPEIEMVIAGKLPLNNTSFAPDPKQIAAELHLTEQVQFCGWIPDIDKPALYALATAYIFPSAYEGFGMMVLEAMGAGTPVITSAV